MTVLLHEHISECAGANCTQEALLYLFLKKKDASCNRHLKSDQPHSCTNKPADCFFSASYVLLSRSFQQLQAKLLCWVHLPVFCRQLPDQVINQRLKRLYHAVNYVLQKCFFFPLAFIQACLRVHKQQPQQNRDWENFWAGQLTNSIAVEGKIYIIKIILATKHP